MVQHERAELTGDRCYLCGHVGAPELEIFAISWAQPLRMERGLMALAKCLGKKG